LAVILGKAYDLKSIDLINYESLNSKLWLYSHLDIIAKAKLHKSKNFDVTSDYIGRAEISAMLASTFNSILKQKSPSLYKKALGSPFIVVKIGISEQNQRIGTIPYGKVVEVISQVNSRWSLVAFKEIRGYVLNVDITEYIPLEGKVIILDPGHGGRDPGALGNDLVEKDINLDVSLKVRDLLEKKGAIVYLTRKIDKTVALPDRFVFSKRYDADIFVSIHTNAHYENFDGTEVYFNKKPYEEDGYANPFSEKSYELAKMIHFSLLEEISTKDNGIYDDAFRVLRKNTVPSALIELGYLSNNSDANKIKSETFRIDSASGIVKGIESYFLSYLE
jgi:N-acetylmuramoyl-L-alanine amidase